MSDPLPFRRPPITRAEQVRARVLEQCLDVTLTKVERLRRYWIRPGRTEGEWYCQVWYGDTQHRGAITDDWQQVHRLKAEYFREMGELEQDGWAISAGVDPRPGK